MSLSLEARREIPAPVRAFVRNSLSMDGGGCLYLMVAVYLGPMVFGSIFMRLGPTTPSLIALYYLGYYALVLVGAPAGLHLRRIRRLARAGYGVEDVLAGAKSENHQRKEELVSTMGRPSRFERVLPMVGWTGFAASVAAVLLMLTSVALTPRLFTGILAGLALWVVGLVARGRRRYLIGERRIKYWGSRFGRWLFKIASAGLPTRAAGVGATHRPTELALAFAAEDLYGELPKEVRAALPELPAVLARLEQHARAVRSRIDKLEQSLADAALDTSHGAAATRRDALVADLSTAHDAARARLAETVVALETIRLDLLRLRAGAGDVARITADLAAAGDIGATVDRLLAAGDEIERALKQTARTRLLGQRQEDIVE